MKKKVVQLTLLGILALSITACGLEAARDDGPKDFMVGEKKDKEETVENSKEQESEEESEPVIEVVVNEYQPSEEFEKAYEEGALIGGDYAVDGKTQTYDDWKEAYEALIDDLDDLKFALIYVDDDDIPELVYSVNEGTFSCATFADKAVNIGPAKGQKLYYIEKGNAVYLEHGKEAATLFDNVIAIKDGKWISVAAGLMSPADVWAEDSFDENGEPIISYWEISDYQLESQDDYDLLLGKYFDTSYGTEVNTFYNAEEIKKQIEAL